jgi:hypothetical protein
MMICGMMTMTVGEDTYDDYDDDYSDDHDTNEASWNDNTVDAVVIIIMLMMSF